MEHRAAGDGDHRDREEGAELSQLTTTKPPITSSQEVDKSACAIGSARPVLKYAVSSSVKASTAPNRCR